MIHIPKNTPLIVIDVQQAFDEPSWGRRNNPDAETKIEQLIQFWRNRQEPIYFIQHISEKKDSLFYIDSDTVQFKTEALPKDGDPVIRKKVNSAFIRTDLLERLKDLQCERVVIAGITTNHCVETTTRMAGNLGFSPILVEDACATFDRKGPDGTLYSAEQIHQMTLVNLHEEFAEIATTEQVLAHFHTTK